MQLGLFCLLTTHSKQLFVELRILLGAEKIRSCFTDLLDGLAAADGLGLRRLRGVHGRPHRLIVEVWLVYCQAQRQRFLCEEWLASISLLHPVLVRHFKLLDPAFQVPFVRDKPLHICDFVEAAKSVTEIFIFILQLEDLHILLVYQLALLLNCFSETQVTLQHLLHHVDSLNDPGCDGILGLVGCIVLTASCSFIRHWTSLGPLLGRSAILSVRHGRVKLWQIVLY